jgi:hypothetical protein
MRRSHDFPVSVALTLGFCNIRVEQFKLSTLTVLWPELEKEEDRKLFSLPLSLLPTILFAALAASKSLAKMAMSVSGVSETHGVVHHGTVDFQNRSERFHAFSSSAVGLAVSKDSVSTSL